MKNHWRKIDDEYWMCFNYDVFLQHGSWRASFYIGRAFKEEFKTPEAAMRFVDTMRPYG